MSKPILFLDRDGPLVPQRAWVLMPRTGMIARKFDPIAVAHLRRLLDKYGAKVVVTSVSAKLGIEDTIEVFEENNFPWHYVHEDWCALDCEKREDSINTWLGRHPEVTRWVALDDERLDLPNLVKVTLADGLLYEHVLELDGFFDGRLPEPPLPPCAACKHDGHPGETCLDISEDRSPPSMCAIPCGCDRDPAK